MESVDELCTFEDVVRDVSVYLHRVDSLSAQRSTKTFGLNSNIERKVLHTKHKPDLDGEKSFRKRFKTFLSVSVSEGNLPHCRCHRTLGVRPHPSSSDPTAVVGCRN